MSKNIHAVEVAHQDKFGVGKEELTEKPVQPQREREDIDR